MAFGKGNQRIKDKYYTHSKVCCIVVSKTSLTFLLQPCYHMTTLLVIVTRHSASRLVLKRTASERRIELNGILM